MVRNRIPHTKFAVFPNICGLKQNRIISITPAIIGATVTVRIIFAHFPIGSFFLQRIPSCCFFYYYSRTQAKKENILSFNKIPVFLLLLSTVRFLSPVIKTLCWSHWLFCFKGQALRLEIIPPYAPCNPWPSRCQNPILFCFRNLFQAKMSSFATCWFC